VIGRSIAGRLRALHTLGPAERDVSGRWSLTQEGVAVVTTGHAAS
jgi:hypothetical protein